jgi:hypothetical protein
MGLISVTEIQGYDSISASRLTINDNFSVISDAVNGVLTLFNTSAGTIDLTSIGTGSISAKALTISSTSTINGTLNVSGTTSLTNVLSTGTLTVNQILFSGASYIFLRELKASGSNTLTGINIYGVTGGTGSNTISIKTNGTFDYMVMPRVATKSDLLNLQNPHVGTIAYIIGTTSIALCVGTSNTPGATGSWVQISSTPLV